MRRITVGLLSAALIPLLLAVSTDAQRAQRKRMKERDSRSPLFVLIHSPLVGPATWLPVADELRRRKLDIVVPTLSSVEGLESRYWQQHVDGVRKSLENVPRERPLVLVGHSGAGVLLPAIRKESGRPVAAYVLVDAIVPVDMKSRLDLFDSAESANEFRRSAMNGRLPVWRDQDLREDIPDPALRRRFVSELRPLPLAVYEEPIPVFAGWPDAPCGYLQFTTSYDLDARRAQSKGCAYVAMKGGHFQMLVDAPTIARALTDLSERLGVSLHSENPTTQR